MNDSKFDPKSNSHAKVEPTLAPAKATVYVPETPAKVTTPVAEVAVIKGSAAPLHAVPVQAEKGNEAMVNEGGHAAAVTPPNAVREPTAVDGNATELKATAEDEKAPIVEAKAV